MPEIPREDKKAPKRRIFIAGIFTNDQMTRSFVMFHDKIVVKIIRCSLHHQKPQMDIKIVYNPIQAEVAMVH